MRHTMMRNTWINITWMIQVILERANIMRGLKKLLPIHMYMIIFIVTCTGILACQDVPPSFVDQVDASRLPPQMPKEDMRVIDEDQWVENDQMPLPMNEDMLIDMEPPPELPEISWVELTVNPARIYYRLSETPQVQVKSFDVYGQALDLPINFEITPPQYATVEIMDDGNTQLSFLNEGEMTLTACVGGPSFTRNDQVQCAQRSLIIDDSLPQVIVHWPKRGAMVTAEDPWPSAEQQGRLPGEESNEDNEFLGQMIPIYGEVLDSQEDLMVKVNQSFVELDESGRFFTMVNADFGYNRIEIIADDQVRNQVVRDVRWVLWSPSLGEFLDNRTYIENGLQLKINQAFLDEDQDVDLQTSPLVTEELAALLYTIVSLINPGELIATSSLINSEAFTLNIEDIELGDPLIDLRFTEQGISLFIGLDQLRLTSSGEMNLANDVLSLDGEIQIGVATFAELILSSTANQPLGVEVAESSITITSIDATFEQASAEALIEALDTQARLLVSDLIDDVFEELITAQIPPLLENSVGSIFNTLRELPINIDASQLGLPVLSLSMLVTPHLIVCHEASHVDLKSHVDIVHNNPIIEQEIELRGYPAMVTQDQTPSTNSSFSFHIQFNTINALLAEVWRGGLLDLIPPLPAETMALVSEAYVQALSPPLLKVADVSQAEPFVLQVAGLMVRLSGNFAPETDEYEVFVQAGARLFVEEGRFSFELEEEPEIQVVIAQQRNEVPVIPTEIIKRVFLFSLWPPLRESLINEIRFGLGAAPLSRGDFAQLGINLSEGSVHPIFQDRVYTNGGWISLEGGIEARLSIQP